ncbi:MAG: nucleoside-diphosphate kinase [Candidatus Thermoplasmatota archaeon]|nr:nucleoside-diphosphate kinase [Candidatus Thermoplasmatota archaeon]
METTFLMVKPDGVHRGLIGKVVSRIEERGLRIVAMKMMKIDRETAEEHYAEHEGKDFYEPLLEYITSGPVVAMAVRGNSAISLIRDIVGETDPQDASPGTIRGDFGIDIGRNIVHAADSEESAERELNIFFKSQDYQEYSRVEENWIYE